MNIHLNAVLHTQMVKYESIYMIAYTPISTYDRSYFND